MTQKTDEDVSFLYPQFFAIDGDLSETHAKLTQHLQLLDKTIALAEANLPDLPQLPLLRALRQKYRLFQLALLKAIEHVQDQLLEMEDGHAKSQGIAPWLTERS